MATEEDKLYHIDCWASFFKAATWEEIKMLAQKDEYIRDAANTIYQLSQEEMIRQQCEAREDYYLRQRDVEYRMQTLLDTNKELLATNAALQAENTRLKKLVSQKLDEMYPKGDIIRRVYDNHSAHKPKETRNYLSTLPEGLFVFVFTPKHGSWLNLAESFFCKMTKQMLKGIRRYSQLIIIRRTSTALH